MQTYDSTVKLARALRPGDVLVAVGPDGEQLVPVREVAGTDGTVTVLVDGRSVTFAPYDEVRIAHPDVARLHLDRLDADAARMPRP